MLVGQKKVLTREQFIQLREARKLIKEEFAECISLSEEDILDTIYEYALRSEGEALFDLFNLINDNATKNGSHQPINSQSQGMGGIAKKAQIGDVINGQTVAGLYRGKPIFK